MTAINRALPPDVPVRMFENATLPTGNVQFIIVALQDRLQVKAGPEKPWGGGALERSQEVGYRGDSWGWWRCG